MKFHIIKKLSSEITDMKFVTDSGKLTVNEEYIDEFYKAIYSNDLAKIYVALYIASEYKFRNIIKFLAERL